MGAHQTFVEGINEFLEIEEIQKTQEDTHLGPVSLFSLPCRVLPILEIYAAFFRFIQIY